MPARRSLLVALALAAVTATAYAPLLRNDFVNYDDDLYVTDAEAVRAGLTRAGVRDALTSFQGANWFPLTRLSWMLDAQLFGVEPLAFHATSFVLHLGAALLLGVALARLSGDFWPAWFTAAVFALHPLHVESVAWAAARKDVLSGLCFALALLCHERRARGTHAIAWSALLAAALALGLMAKPMLVTLPCVLLLLDLWPLGRLSEGGRSVAPRLLARRLVEKLPLFALAGAAAALTVAAQRAGDALQALERYPLGVRLANAADSVCVYLVQSVWPSGLAVFYPYPHGGIAPARSALAVAVLVGLSVLALRTLRSRPYLFVGWAWFLGMLVPVSGLVQVGQAARADRYTYLPLIGLSIALAWGARDLVARWPAARVALRRAAVLALALLALLSFAQVGTWRDSIRLFEHALSVTRRNHVAHINLAAALAAAGRFEDADAHLTRALAMVPGSAKAHGLRGEVRLAQERADAAAVDLESALRLEPGAPRWLVALARVRLVQGRAPAAEATLRGALAAEPESAAAHALLGLALAQQGRHAAAVASYRRALAQGAPLERAVGREGVARVRRQLVSALEATGRLGEALREIDAAVALAPELGELHAQRAALLERGGRQTEAIAAYREALRRGARTPLTLNNLAWLLATAAEPRLRAPDEAVRLAGEAVDATGGLDASVLDTLGVAQAAAGRTQLARETAERALALAEAEGQEALARAIRERLAGEPPR